MRLKWRPERVDEHDMTLEERVLTPTAAEP
jgi:hypothetical protein